MYNKEIIKKIQSFYKKDINILEISFVNYEGINYYIRLDKDKKKDLCYLRSVNFNFMKKFDSKLINQEVLLFQPVSVIVDILKKAQIIELDNSRKNINNDLVDFKANIDDKTYKYSFTQFIPLNLPFLVDIFFIIFSNLPKRLNPLFDELVAALNHNEIKYTYKKPFKFNLFKDDIDVLFDKKVRDKGEEEYQNQNVRFLEQINESYYAVMEDIKNKRLQSIIVNYNEKDKILSMTCNCPLEARCEHMYAVLKAIKNKEQYNFYKVRFIDNHNANMYDKLFTLNYYLCLGIDTDKLIILFPNGDLSAIPVLDQFGKITFEVVEDDDDKSLTKLIKDLKK